MNRVSLSPRLDWRAKVEGLGLIWHSTSESIYWNESAYYSFTSSEISALEKATTELYGLFLTAGQYVIDNKLFDRFAIPEWCWPLITQAWQKEPPALNYGRFDLGFDGEGPPKLFEFNCDTPTSLLEAAVIQWAWKEEVLSHLDQFNDLHAKLVAKWKDIAPQLVNGRIHFAHSAQASGEDAVTTAYLMDTAREAGLEVDGILMADLGWDGARWLDLQNREIQTLSHLYPWEWLVHEPFGRHLAQNNTTIWIEPIWKMMWSNKAILPILWDLYPQHPNLLRASFAPEGVQNYVSKPMLAREGANIEIVKAGVRVSRSGGPYDDSPRIFQELYELPDFDGNRPVIGSWLVDGEPAGIGVREDGLITGNSARFVPHVIVD